MNSSSKICLARVDRIGDLVLTLPCEEFWKIRRPQDQIEWLAEDSLKFVIDHAEPRLGAATYVKNSSGILNQWRSLLRLTQLLRVKAYDEVVAFHVPWWVAAAFFFAGIKKRHGVASQWYSWLFFNHRLRQKRSLAVQHESQYNFDLVDFALGHEKISTSPRGATLKASAGLTEKWIKVLKEKNLDLSRLVVVHAGMGGSARNWPPAFYKSLTEKMISNKISVVLTGGPLDQEILEGSGLLKISGIISLLNQTQGADLLAVLSLAKVLVAPSTGVAHLAAALGVSTAAIYSPVLVQAPLRWKPVGPDVKVFVAQVDCPGNLRCLGNACPHFDCMEQIPVDSVLAYVMDNL